MRPLTFTRPKPVLRVAGQPIIRYAIHNLLQAGIRDIGVVVSDITRDEIEHVTEPIEGAHITLINQHHQLGLGHAVLSAADWLGDSDFCVYLGDNLFERGIASYVQQFQAQRPAALIALVEVENPTAFGVVEIEGQRIHRLVEKPVNPPSNLAVAGFYCFTPEILPVLRGLKPSARGEYEITDAIQGLVDADQVVLGQRVKGWWKDTGRPQDLLEANRLLLEQLPPCIKGTLEASRITGRVHVPASARVSGSKIVGPVRLGEGVVIEDAYIGPFTSVGEGSVIRGSEIESSVIDAEVYIENVPTRLQDCLIGLRACVKGGRRLPRTHKLTISDASVVELA